MSIADNINLVKNNIKLAAEKSSRKPDEIILVCVTKQIPVEFIKEALSGGINIIGENRVEEALEKKDNLPASVELHMIGHLQTRKAKDAVKIFSLIHSVDSLRLAEEINKRAGAIGKIQDILLEVNISGEETKYGFKPEDMLNCLEKIASLKNIKILGLMTMAPFTDDADVTRPVFRELGQLAEIVKGKNIQNVEMKYLSMGMSQDYTVAIEEGANMVRIGSSIFGDIKGE